MLHEIASINALAFLTDIGCIKFDSDHTVAYDLEILAKQSSYPIEKIFKPDNLCYRDNLRQEFDPNPRQCISNLLKVATKIGSPLRLVKSDPLPPTTKLITP